MIIFNEMLSSTHRYLPDFELTQHLISPIKINQINKNSYAFFSVENKDF